MHIREKFNYFISSLSSYLSSNHSDVGFYIYGSYVSDKPNPEDLDGGIVMPEVVTDKDKVLSISREINNSLLVVGLNFKRLQFSLIDRVTSEDGRFASYDSSYTFFHRKYAEVRSGEVDFEKFAAMDNKFGELSSSAFNFRAIRNNFLLIDSLTALDNNSRLLGNFSHSIDKLEMLPRKMRALQIYRENDDKYEVLASFLNNETKKDALQHLPEIVGDLDLEIFGEIPRLKDSMEVERLGRNEDALICKWKKVLTTYEQIVKGFIDNNQKRKVNVETVI